VAGTGPYCPTPGAAAMPRPSGGSPAGRGRPPPGRLARLRRSAVHRRYAISMHAAARPGVARPPCRASSRRARPSAPIGRTDRSDASLAVLPWNQGAPAIGAVNRASTLPWLEDMSSFSIRVQQPMCAAAVVSRRRSRAVAAVIDFT
jgi:hypothetical protein